MEELIKRGDVFYANLDGDTYGSEQKGTRPVIIVQNNSGNKFSKTVIIVPITKAYHKKSALPTHIILEPSDFIKYKSIILTEQIDLYIQKKSALSFQHKDLSLRDKSL